MEKCGFKPSRKSIKRQEKNILIFNNMAVNFRLEKDNNDSVSFVMEDTDGSGDLNRILGKLANKHVAEGTTNQPISEACMEIMQAMVEESEVIFGQTD